MTGICDIKQILVTDDRYLRHKTDICDRWQISVTILLSCSLLYVMGHSWAQNLCVSHISNRTFQTLFTPCEISAECECVTVCHCVSLCVTVCHCVPLCATVCHCVPLCATVCHCVSLCVTVCHCVSLCVTVCHCVSHYVLLVCWWLSVLEWMQQFDTVNKYLINDTEWWTVTHCETLSHTVTLQTEITHLPPLYNIFCINTVFSYIFSISIVTRVTSVTFQPWDH